MNGTSVSDICGGNRDRVVHIKEIERLADLHAL